MEAIIRDKILSHFKVNMLFTDKQFGFLKGRSTTLQLLQILDQWTECLEHGGQVDVIYTDLEKAFDKIPHRRLISKLHSSCIHNYIVEWLEAFLSNRKQRVRIGNTFSNWAAVISYKNPPSNTGVIVEKQVACIYGCQCILFVHAYSVTLA